MRFENKLLMNYIWFLMAYFIFNPKFVTYKFFLDSNKVPQQRVFLDGVAHCNVTTVCLKRYVQLAAIS
jgi:hypothetical protein